MFLWLILKLLSEVWPVQRTPVQQMLGYRVIQISVRASAEYLHGSFKWCTGGAYLPGSIAYDGWPSIHRDPSNTHPPPPPPINLTATQSSPVSSDKRRRWGNIDSENRGTAYLNPLWLKGKPQDIIYTVQIYDTFDNNFGICCYKIFEGELMAVLWLTFLFHIFS